MAAKINVKSDSMDFLIAKTVPWIVRIVMTISIIAFLLEQYTIILSVMLGVFFSYWGFKNLVKTQVTVLTQQSKSVTFIGYIARMGIYAIPMILGIRLNQYFNLWVILLSLFTFQYAAIVAVFMRSKKRLKSKDI